MVYILEIVKHVQKKEFSVMQADILKHSSADVVSKNSASFEIIALGYRL